MCKYNKYSIFHSEYINSLPYVSGDLMEGLASKGLDKDYTHLLTGYVASPSFLNCIIQVVKQLKKHNPNLIYGKAYK